MRLPFSKMHGLGNDFVMLDATSRPVALSVDQLRHLADRRRGIGCDQVIIVDPADGADVDFRYRIYNADGGESGQCGNGARCLYRFVRDRGLSDREEIAARTAAGTVHLRGAGGGQVSVDMGEPRLAPRSIPFQAEAEAEAVEYALEAGGRTVAISAVSMGNPHAVLLVDDVDTAPVAELGPAIGRHERFPEQANVGFMQVLAPDAIRLRVYERGAGETPACGTGACAAVVAGRLRALLGSKVRVELPGGELIIEWEGAGHPVWMTGPATHVYEGSIDL